MKNIGDTIEWRCVNGICRGEIKAVREFHVCGEIFKAYEVMLPDGRYVIVYDEELTKEQQL